jgi:hypothetical protein
LDKEILDEVTLRTSERSIVDANKLNREREREREFSRRRDVRQERR